MERAKEIRDFLVSRRAKITPGDVGLPRGPRRRVAGLRREEVALLAGVSAEYYIQIERGQVGGASDEVLNAIATALRLDEDETAHLLDMVRAVDEVKSGPSRRHRAVSAEQVPHTIQALLDSMTAPAIVQNPCLDILATNTLGRALYTEVIERTTPPANVARFLFLDEHADHVFPAWDEAAADAVGLLHVAAARAPRSRRITELIGELATRSLDFRTRWAAHDVRGHRRGTKRFRHPDVGELALRYDVLDIASAESLSLVGYTAEPGSPSADALGLLASWTATGGVTSVGPPRVHDPADADES